MSKANQHGFAACGCVMNAALTAIIIVIVIIMWPSTFVMAEGVDAIPLPRQCVCGCEWVGGVWGAHTPWYLYMCVCVCMHRDLQTNKHQHSHSLAPLVLEPCRCGCDCCVPVSVLSMCLTTMRLCWWRHIQWRGCTCMRYCTDLDVPVEPGTQAEPLRRELRRGSAAYACRHQLADGSLCAGGLPLVSSIAKLVAGLVHLGFMGRLHGWIAASAYSRRRAGRNR